MQRLWVFFLSQVIWLVSKAFNVKAVTRNSCYLIVELDVVNQVNIQFWLNPFHFDSVYLVLSESNWSEIILHTWRIGWKKAR